MKSACGSPPAARPRTRLNCSRVSAGTSKRGMEKGFPALPDAHATKPITVRPNFEKEEYKAAVDRMIRYIIEGDIYIANMTQRLDVMSDREPLAVFEYLRTHNPLALRRLS